MKINSTYVWSNLVVVPVLFYIITYLFYRGNTDAYDYVDTYLNQSKIIKVTIPQKCDENWGRYSFRFGKKGSRNYYQFVFYSAKYNKYLAIVSFGGMVLSLKVCKYSFYSILSFHSFLFSLSSF